MRHGGAARRAARLAGTGAAAFVCWIVFFAPAAAAAEAPGAVQTPAADVVIPTIENGSLVPAERPEQVATVLVVAALLTILTLCPSILIMTTCFTRIVIVFGFLRRALATQQLPPNPVVMGMALFLTLFVMQPTWEASWNDGIRPYLHGEKVDGRLLSQAEAFERTLAPAREFMFRCLEDNRGRHELETFLNISGRTATAETMILRQDVPTHILIPAFVSSELKRAFWMGFLLYLPFLVIDMVISSVLMSMGMMMLPPVMISLPFKIILFVIVDGWRLLVEGLVLSFPVMT